jgi:penicillin-binding protein 1A
VLVQSTPVDITEDQRAIPARNAFTMTSLLQEVTRSGTAARAQATLKRPDVYGKTGTTNDAMDAWFAGYQPTLAAIVWIGYDTPRKLGDRETGGGLSLPIWIKYMETALRNVPVQEPSAPEGLVQVGGEWFYTELGASGGVRNLGGTSAAGKTESEALEALPKTDERSRIIDLFRN